MPKFVFLDTMIYLHFRPAADIDWLELLDTDEVQILVPKIIISELDKHKDTHARSKVKNRARSMLQLLETATENGPHQLRTGVTLVRFTKRPRFDLAAYDLDPSRNDDQLIASALEFKSERPDADVIVISGDAAARLTAKDVGLQAMALPEEYQVRHEIDPAEEELRQLRDELKRVRQTHPKLSVRFQEPARGNRMHVTLAPVLDLDAYLRREMAIVEAKYPALAPKRRDGSFGHGIDLALVYSGEPSKREFDRYNSERQPFFEAYAQYLRGTWDSFVRERLGFRVALEVANEGTAVATDVDIFFRFPDWLEVLDSELENRLKVPRKPPRPPVKPRSSAQFLVENIGSPVIRPTVPDYASHFRSTQFREPPNLKGPSIEKDGDTQVSWTINRVKHNQLELLHPIVVVFKSYESARSFKIEYTVHAGNLPDELTGQLHVVVQKA